MKTRFLLDENLDPAIMVGLLRRNTSIEIVRVGDPDILPRATPEPDILRYAEQTGYLLITENRVSMAAHLAAHFEAGRRHWGVFHVRRGVSIGQLIEELQLIWEVSDAEEWRDRVEWIPF